MPEPLSRRNIECGDAVQGISLSAVLIERTVHPVPQGGVSADQRGCVVRGGVEPPTFRFSGQPRSAQCRPSKQSPVFAGQERERSFWAPITDSSWSLS